MFYKNKLDYLFNNPELFRLSLTHPTVSFKNNNQRLEFLGDSVLNFILSGILYLDLPFYKEGLLTKVRSYFTQRKLLSNLAIYLDISNKIIINKSALKNGVHLLKSVLEDTIEAIIGAIYLDGGLNNTILCVIKWYYYLNKNKSLEFKSNAKGTLQEFLQKQYLPIPKYFLIDSIGIINKRIYTVIVNSYNILGIGSATTIKSAEEEAATNVLLLVN